MKQFKRLLFWFLVLLFLEFLFSFLIYDNYQRSSIINIILFIIPCSSVLTILTSSFSNKINNIIKNVLLLSLAITYSIQFVFIKIFNSYFSISIFALADQAFGMVGTTLRAIIVNIYGILIFLIPFIISLIFRKKYSFNRLPINSNLTYLGVIVIGILFFILNINIQKSFELSAYDLYHNVNEMALNVEKLGVINASFLDLKRTIFGFNTKLVAVDNENMNDENNLFEYDYNNVTIDFNNLKTSINDIKTLNKYMSNEKGTKKNKYSGMFKDYNLIYIVAESFSQIAISKELTPTLYELVNGGFIFNNFYTPNNLSTIGGEFQALTGLYADNTILSKWRSGTNYFPYGLGNMFTNIGYKTYAYHNNWYAFQDRHKYLKSQGFTNYLGCQNGLEKLMNCNTWPESDNEMIKNTINQYINDDKFMAYYMTVSGHFDYTYSANYIARKHKKKVDDLEYSSRAKAYLATQIELDLALETLINLLEENNKLDNTVIVLLADHYPYKLSLNDINSISNYKRDSVVEVNHNSLIIWNNKMKDVIIEKPCMSIDVLPTVYNLYGMEYDSRLIVGKDILSTENGLAILKNRSFVSGYGTYFSSSNRFVSNEYIALPENYVSNINKLISSRLSASKLIVKNNYYNYILN